MNCIFCKNMLSEYSHGMDWEIVHEEIWGYRCNDCRVLFTKTENAIIEHLFYTEIEHLFYTDLHRFEINFKKNESKILVHKPIKNSVEPYSQTYETITILKFDEAVKNITPQNVTEKIKLYLLYS